MGRVGQLEVDDQPDVVDVDPASRHVGGHEDLALPAAEGRHRAVADVLREVALKLDGVVAEATKAVVELDDAVLGPAEHDRRRAVAPEDLAERAQLVVAGDAQKAVLERAFEFRLDADPNVIPGVLLDHPGNPLRHGGRREHGLGLVGLGQHLLDDRGEPRIEHLVGLVQHEVLDA